MTATSVYLAQAIDGRDTVDIMDTQEMYASLLATIGVTLASPLDVESYSADAFDAIAILQHDLSILRKCDALLVDLSLVGHEYLGCLFEIGCANAHGIPVVVCIGNRNLERRVALQGACQFIVREPEQAIECLLRGISEAGVRQQMKETQAYYDAIARTYDAASGRDMAPRDLHAAEGEKNALRETLRKFALRRVCQIGIGTGAWTETICETADVVVGIDASPSMLMEARRRLAGFGNVQFVLADVLGNDVQVGTVDCVVCCFLLSLLPQSMQKRLFAAVRRILKPGGVVVVADSKRPANYPGVGLGRCRIQTRSAGGTEYTVYKEHFGGQLLRNLLEDNGYEVVHAAENRVWLTWAVARDRRDNGE